MSRLRKPVAFLLVMVMLFAYASGSFAAIQSNIVTLQKESKATAGPRHIFTEADNITERTGESTLGTGTEGIQFYAYRTWSETEQRDYVTFNSNDVTKLTSLWSFPQGMVSAEYYDGTIYALDDNLVFHAIDAETGASTDICTMSYILYDMTYDYTSETMFGIAFSYAEGSRKLARIDLATGEIIIMGQFNISANMISLTAGRTPGVLYGIDDLGEIYTISAYGVCTPLASTGYTVNYTCSMTYCYENDMIYWQHNPGQQFVEINPLTGACTEIGTFLNYAILSGLSVKPAQEDLPPVTENNSVTQIILNTDSMYIAPGVERQLAVTIVPYNADNQKVTWRSNNEAVATVNATGLVTGVGVGQAIITVTSDDGGYTDTCTVDVTDEPVTIMGFRLFSQDGGYGDYLKFTDTNPSHVEVMWNLPFELYSSEYYNGELYACDWSTQNFSKINIETGELTPIGHCEYSFLGLSYNYINNTMLALTFTGSDNIICSVDLDTAEITQVCVINSDLTFRGFSVARDGKFYAIDQDGNLYTIADNGTVNLIGATGYTTEYAMQSMAYDYQNDCLYWANYPTGELIRVNTETAEAESMGLIGKGTQLTAMTIITSDKYLPNSDNEFPVTGVTVSPTEFKVIPGVDKQLKAFVTPWNADDPSVTWSSANEAIATVDSNGCVIGVSEGITTITVTTNDGGFTATSTVTVLESGIKLYGSRVFSNGDYGDCITIYDYDLDNLESNWNARSLIYAGDYCDGKLYAYAQNTGMFFEVDPYTGESRVIGTCQYQLYEMAYDYTTKAMYCMTFIKEKKYMARVNLDTAEVTVIGAFDSNEQMLTLCGGRDGAFYGVDFNGDFYKIDREAHCTLIGKTGFTANFLQSMTYDYTTDSIYWAQYPDGLLIKIDPKTGVGKSLGAMTDSPEIGALYSICDEKYLPKFIGGTEVTGVKISNESIKLSLTSTKKLSATVAPYNAEIRDVTWESSNTAVATVDENGLVKSVSVGTATITATTRDGAFTTTSEVTVVESGTEYYAYRNNGIDKYNDWVKLTDTDTDKLTSLWDAEQEIYAAETIDGELYVAYRFGNFIKADIETGKYTVIGKPQTSYQIWGMTYSYLSKTMYVLVYDTVQAVCVLGTISLDNAKISIVGNFGCENGIQMIEAGRDGLYAMDNAGNLLMVNPKNAACTFIAATEVMIPFIASLEYDYKNDMFIWTQNCWGFNQDGYIISLDPKTGAREYIGTIGEGGDQPILTGLVIVPDEADLPLTETFTVTFLDWDDTIIAEVNVETGEDAIAPPDPQREGYMFVGWKGNYTNVTSDVTVRAMYALKGDVNGDGLLNTGDAVLILRYSAGLVSLNEEQKKIADFNQDGKLNTGDAVAILKYCVGL